MCKQREKPHNFLDTCLQGGTTWSPVLVALKNSVMVSVFLQMTSQLLFWLLLLMWWRLLLTCLHSVDRSCRFSCFLFLLFLLLLLLFDPCIYLLALASFFLTAIFCGHLILLFLTDALLFTLQRMLVAFACV